MSGRPRSLFGLARSLCLKANSGTLFAICRTGVGGEEGAEFARNQGLPGRQTLIARLCGMLLLVLPRLATADELPAAEVPLRRIVLFNSGVGFYEHAGPIEGSQQVELKFNVSEINDLLKSLVLRDQGGGRISTVAYNSKDPAARTLATFAINLTREPTMADLLRQVRGEKLQLMTAAPISGTLLGVERRQIRVNKDEMMAQDFVNLLTTTGLKSVPLDTVAEVRLLNPTLNLELQQALAILAARHASEKKAVTMQFVGQGRRDVRIGYIQESPVWKTSYRLVLDDDKHPFLQGWAIVENTTEQDWKVVSLTLVSGRPISFVMDLYDPLYATRPVLVPAMYANLESRTYDQDLAERQAAFEARANGQDAGGIPRRRGGSAFGGAAGGMGGGMGAGGGMGGGAIRPGFGIAQPASTPMRIDLAQGIVPAASAQQVGELFRYAIDAPVSIARQQSAMLPIVNQLVEGEKLSIYNESVDTKHPLNGLRLKNTTELHLMQGPITVFDGGEYAGDARIEDLAPLATRLVSYALDLDTEIAPTKRTPPRDLLKLRIVNRTVLTSYRQRRTQQYVVKNSGSKKKNVLIEHPFEAAWKLIAPPQPTERTRSLYRFAVAAEPGRTTNLSIEEELVVGEEASLEMLPRNMIEFYIGADVVSPAIKKALIEMARRQDALAAKSAELDAVNVQLKAIIDDQGRIRQNMNQLDHGSDLYKRYVAKFTEQEDDVERLRKQVLRLQAERESMERELRLYLTDQTLE